MMRGTIKRRLERSGRCGDAGLSLAELIMVIAMSSIVLSMVIVVTVSLAKHDQNNLARQGRVDQLRVATVWLTDALAYASGESTNMTNNPVANNGFTKAAPTEMVFMSALGTPEDANNHALSEVRVVLGEECWGSSGGDQTGVLHRCVSSPRVTGGTAAVCVKGSSDCPDSLFEDLVLARGVVDGPIFTYYYLSGDTTISANNVLEANVPNIRSVEMVVTVGDPEDDSTTATVFKRFTINEWSRF
jgi:hypothetical protein